MCSRMSASLAHSKGYNFAIGLRCAIGLRFATGLRHSFLKPDCCYRATLLKVCRNSDWVPAVFFFYLSVYMPNGGLSGLTLKLPGVHRPLRVSAGEALTSATLVCSPAEIVGPRVWRRCWFVAIYVQYLRCGDVHVGLCRGSAGWSCFIP
jgi:hypothetical protein